jgi:hypothetical protein
VRVDDAIEYLRQQRASLRCDDLVGLFTGLGFDVRPCGSPGHYVVKHSGIKDLRFNFAGGHGRNSQLLTCYVDNARRVLRQFHDELVKLESETNSTTKPEK